MKGFALDEIMQATSGRLLYKGADFFSGVSIDSRKITDSELFVALRGARFDGHDFLDEALERGAGALVNYPPLAPVSGKTIIHVGNTLKALQDIARFRRISRDAAVIGITGTNGKTSTKEMVCSVVRNYTRVLCSSGNLNNQIGLPLNLMKLDGEGFCVLEMGASRPGDIRELCDIALPDYGIVTNIGPGHLEGFGSLEVVRDTKLEIASYVKILVFNGDDELLQGIISSHAGAKRKNYVSYGIRKDSPVMAKNIRTPGAEENRTGGIRFDLYLEGRKTVTIKLKVPGLFNVYNALAAAAMAHVLGIPEEVIKTGLEEFAGVPFRLEIKNMRGAVVISDMYNANPASMEEAVKELVRIKDKRAIAVLGDMLELGSYAETAHKKLGAWLAELPVDIFIGVGPLMEAAISEFRACAQDSRVVLPSPDADEAGKILDGLLAEGDTVLIKGSRGMNMERILEEI